MEIAMFKRVSKCLAGGVAVTAITFSLAQSGFAHDGVKHDNLGEALAHQEETSPNTSGFPEVKGGDFDLIDHDGNKRTSKDPNDRFQLIFFGYANCKAICSVALPRMAAAVDLLLDQNLEVTPLLITVDPERDTLNNMKGAMAHHHEKMIGLTGSEEKLAVAYEAFNVEKSLVYEHPEEGPIYAHGSFIYLIGPDGEFKTLMPPILSPERMAQVAKSYITGEK